MPVFQFRAYIIKGNNNVLNFHEFHHTFATMRNAHFYYNILLQRSIGDNLITFKWKITEYGVQELWV